MPLTDRAGLQLTTQSPQAAESYYLAVDLLLSANAGAEALLDAALAADPEFALARIARARLCQVQARMPEAKQAAAAARGLRDRVSAREQGTIEVIALTIDGAGPQAMARLEAHTAEYPRDALALSLALGVFGLLGFSGRLDHHEAQLALLERLAPPLFNLADAASFLWRWRIYGETPPLDEPWEEVVAHAKRYFPGAGMPFADVHAAFAEAVSGEDAALATRIAQLGELMGAGR